MTSLLRAANLLRRDGFDFRLTMAGSGFRASGLRGIGFGFFVRHWPSRTESVFPDTLRMIASRICSALPTSLLLPSSVVRRSGESNGIPNVIMEALAAGVPVVATRRFHEIGEVDRAP